MRTISSLADLEPFGIVPLTGEACGLMLRVLCDTTERGRKLVARTFGLPADVKLAEPWNRGTKEDPHVGSVMLAHDHVYLLGVMALLTAGHEHVYAVHKPDGRYNATRFDGVVALDNRPGNLESIEENLEFYHRQGYSLYRHRLGGVHDPAGQATSGHDRNEHLMSGRIE